MGFVGWYETNIVGILSILGFFFCITLFSLDWKRIIGTFAAVGKSTWLLLFLITLVGAIIRIFLIPSFHQMYVDEPMYIEQAKNINQQGKIVSCVWTWEGSHCWSVLTKGPLWPFILSLAFRALGSSSSVAFMVTQAFALLTIALSFIFCYLVFKRSGIGLWCSIFFALSPLHAVWSNTVETSMPALFFVMLTFISFLLFTRLPSIPMGVFTGLVFLFSVFIRYENLLLTPVFLLLLLLNAKSLPSSVKRSISALMPAIATLIGLLTFTLFFFTIEFYMRNLSNFLPHFYAFNLPFYLKHLSLNFTLLIPGIFGLVLLGKNQIKLCLIGIPLLISSIIYIPLSYESRMILIPFFFFSVCAAYGAEELAQKAKRHQALFRASALLLLLAVSAFSLSPAQREPLYKKYPSLNMLETFSASTLHETVPSNCTIISQFPAITNAATDSIGMETSYALQNPSIIQSLLAKNECVYYFYDHYCYRIVSDSSANCKRMMDTFKLLPEANYPNGDKAYTLYRVVGLTDYHNGGDKA